MVLRLILILGLTNKKMSNLKMTEKFIPPIVEKDDYDSENVVKTPGSQMGSPAAVNK